MATSSAGRTIWITGCSLHHSCNRSLPAFLSTHSLEQTITASCSFSLRISLSISACMSQYFAHPCVLTYCSIEPSFDRKYKFWSTNRRRKAVETTTPMVDLPTPRRPTSAMEASGEILEYSSYFLFMVSGGKFEESYLEGKFSSRRIITRTMNDGCVSDGSW